MSTNEDAAGARMRLLASIGLLALYVTGDLALRRISLSSGIIPWYPSAGIGLAFLVLTGARGVPALLGVRILLYLAPGRHPVVVDPLVAMLESSLVVGAYLGAANILRRRVVEGLESWRVEHAGWLICAIAIAALAAAVTSLIPVTLVRGALPDRPLALAADFAAGDASGALVVLPLLLLLFRRFIVLPGGDTGGWRRFPGRTERQAIHPDSGDAPSTRRGEGLALAAAVVLATIVSGVLLRQGGRAAEYATVVCFVPLMWAAVRHDIDGVAAVLAVYGLSCLALSASGGIPPEGTLTMQAALISLGVVGLLVGAAHTESTESAARYWHLLVTAGEGVWRVDSNGKSLYVNPQMASLLGRPADDILGREVQEFIAPEDRASWTLERERRKDGTDGIYQTRLVRPDGERVSVLVRASVVRSTAGVPLGSIAFVSDVTALQRAEAARRLAQELLEATFRSSRDAMILYRARDEQIIDVNEVWCQVTGYAREDVLGRSQRELRIWGDPADAARVAEALREHGVVRDFEIAFNHTAPDGTPERRYALLSAVPAEAAGEQYLLVSGRDITADKRREEAERQVRRLEELGRLSGSVAHDFNNLLTVVLAYTQFAMECLTAGEAVRPEDLKEIEGAAVRGRALTRGLLAFSRTQVIEPAIVDLREVITEALGMLRSVLPNTEVNVVQPEVPLRILADPTQIDQILLNFAVNARDAMPQGGRFTIRTGVQRVAEGDVAERVGPDALPGEYVMMEVSDTGVGMDAAVAARVFEPFFTTKGHSQGTGLGLAVVFGIVRQARGTVRVSSTPGLGTTFIVCWPSAPMASVPGKLSATTDSSTLAGPGGERILLVEDDGSILRIVRRVLEDNGYEVHAETDGERALRRLSELERDGVPPDLVLSDVLMPGVDGRELARRLLATRPSLPVVLMSGHTGSPDGHQELRNVIGPVVSKPFEVAELLSAVRAGLRRRSPPPAP